jgi:methylated-DNA-protein-cysteine methyltransferase related protein
MPGKSAAEKIIAAIRAVPRGQVAGYGEIARRAGLPGRARLVARMLSVNEDSTLPWHRILRSDGRIAFPDDDPHFAEQSQRLRAEGVTVVNGRVRGQKAASTLDEILWKP